VCQYFSDWKKGEISDDNMCSAACADGKEKYTLPKCPFPG